MRRVISLCIFLPMAFGAWGQVKLPQVRSLESQGWQVQHSVMSWDSLSIYFSARGPQDHSYELYMLRAEGFRWGSPERIVALCTDADECWPTISSDEGMILYVVENHIWRAWYRGGQWTEAAPIIITNGHDNKPQLLEDNHTLLFERQEETKKGNGPWQSCTATMIDDHNWTFPQVYTERPQASPILALSGTIIDAKSGRPLSKGRVMVYDAVNEQLKQTARVHPATGRWRVALAAKQQYRIALTAEGYSYHYIDVRTDALSAREERGVGEITLNNKLALTINTYDAETQDVLASKKSVLPLRKMHEVALEHPGYADTSLMVNTLRPTVFTETELDIPLHPKKSLHHFRVSNRQDNTPVPEATLRLNGQETTLDTALRIGREASLQVSAPGYLFFDTLIHTGNDTRERMVEVGLQPLQKDLVLQLRNIQFEYASYELTESSNTALEALAQLMFINPTLRIELSAHTDDQGSDRYNDRLSTLRGEAVTNWLVQRGIDGQRMEAKGYGKRKPLVPNDSDENRALNRRVEIKVIEF